MQYTETRENHYIHCLLVHVVDERTKSFCFGEWDRTCL